MSLLIKVKVITAAGKQKLFLDKSGKMKCRLKSTPEKGKANSELIKYLSKLIKMPTSKIRILSGHTSKNKTLKIETDLTEAKFCKQFCDKG